MICVREGKEFGCSDKGIREPKANGQSTEFSSGACNSDCRRPFRWNDGCPEGGTAKRTGGVGDWKDWEVGIWPGEVGVVVVVDAR
jgi:hypothetical protein